MRWLERVAAIVVALLAVLAGVLYWYLGTYDERESSRVAYAQNCARCHGAALEGGDHGPLLSRGVLNGGDSTPELIASINRHVVPGSPDWANTLPPHTIKALALYISEQRQAFPTILESQAHNLPGGSSGRSITTFALSTSPTSRVGPIQWRHFPVVKFLWSRKYAACPWSGSMAGNHL